MTDLIYFEIPLLTVIPLVAVIFSVLAKAFSKAEALAWISAAVHALCIAAIIGFGGGLADVFTMLVLSLIASALSDRCAKCNRKGGNVQ